MSIFSLGEVKVKQTENIENSNFNSWPESGFYGYFGGGYSGVFSSGISRLDFFIETVTEPRSTLSQARENLASVSSNSYGYFAGGYDGTPPNPYVSSIDRLDFSTEVLSILNSNYNYPAGASGVSRSCSSTN